MDKFLEKELEGVGCKTVKELFLKIWGEAQESPDYDKRKLAALQYVLEYYKAM